jgi:zinc transport system substrate-binding protein
VAFAAQVEVVYTTLSTVFPEGADTFRENADAYKEQLLALDAGFSSALGDSGTCTTDTVAANHNAYAYISQRYGVEFVNLHGLDPEGEPSPDDIAEVLESVEEDGITAIYVEEYSPNGALDSLIQQTVSDDLPDGIAILTLYTMEMAPSDAGEDYLSLMTKNLDNLKIGLGC